MVEGGVPYVVEGVYLTLNKALFYMGGISHEESISPLEEGYLILGKLNLTGLRFFVVF